MDLYAAYDANMDVKPSRLPKGFFANGQPMLIMADSKTKAKFTENGDHFVIQHDNGAKKTASTLWIPRDEYKFVRDWILGTITEVGNSNPGHLIPSLLNQPGGTESNRKDPNFWLNTVTSKLPSTWMRIHPTGSTLPTNYKITLLTFRSSPDHPSFFGPSIDFSLYQAEKLAETLGNFMSST